MEVSVKIIEALHESMLKRRPTEAESANWNWRLGSVAGVYDLIEHILSSAEYKAIQGVVTSHAPGHFYSPVVDPATISSERMSGLRAETEEIDGVDLRWDAQFAIWNDVISCPIIPERRWRPVNGTYGPGDAIVMSGIIRHFRPTRVVEIGSGFSSARLLDTIDHLGLDTKVAFIEPYPATLLGRLSEEDKQRYAILGKPVQQVAPEQFAQLEAGDILFIDSTHVLKTGSDVHYELFEILPSLKSGVIVHFHDMFWPFEYPPGWIFHTRYSWNELYAVRLLLLGGGYEIEFFNDAFHRFQMPKIEQAPAHVADAMKTNQGGGLWLRKI